jgi:hypothetical protein
LSAQTSPVPPTSPSSPSVPSARSVGSSSTSQQTLKYSVYRGTLPDGMSHEQAVSNFTAEVTDWVGTWNNPSAEETNLVQELCSNGSPLLTFACGQLELGGEEKTPHLQFFLQFTRSRKMAWVRKFLGAGPAHWPFLEPRKGTPLEAADYCSKVETRVSEPWRSGELRQFVRAPRDVDIPGEPPKKRGRVSDLMEVSLKVAAGESPVQLAKQYPTTFVKYASGLSSLASVCTPKRDHTVRLYLFVGEQGSSKSTSINRKWPGAYWVSPPNRRGGPVWYPAYNNEKVLVYDDFDGWVDLATMLRICDRFPLIVQGKNTSFQLLADTVVISSTIEPAKWWPECDLYERGFYRRITRCLLFTVLGGSRPSIDVISCGPEYFLNKDIPPTSNTLIDWDSVNRQVDDAIDQSAAVLQVTDAPQSSQRSLPDKGKGPAHPR